MSHAYCPHCLNLLGETLPWPPAALRCPQCRLVVGAGRALDATEASRNQSATAAAAGVASNAARRHGAEPVAEERVLRAIRQVAAELGVAVNQLRMLDYEACTRADRELPALAEVLATCGTWKRARALAEPQAARVRAAGDPAPG